MKLGSEAPVAPEEKIAPTLHSSRWILSTFNNVLEGVTHKLSTYEISIAADELYSFSWTVFCDWYLEMMKVLSEKGDASTKREVYWTTVTLFRNILTTLHPIIPFLTEEIYQKLPFLKSSEVLASAAWPKKVDISETSTEIPLIMEIVTGVRSVKAALGIPHKKIRVALSGSFSPEGSLLIQELAKVEFCQSEEITPEKALRKPYSTGTVLCEVDGKEAYRQKIEKDIVSNRAIIGNLEQKLSGSFASQAKPEIVEKEREKLASAKHTVAELESELAGLS